MGFHPKAIAICLNLKMEASQLLELEKIHFHFSNKMYPLNAHNSFITHVAKRSFTTVPKLLIVNKTWVNGGITHNPIHNGRKFKQNVYLT